MHDEELRDLGKRLLDEGVAPKHVKRTVRELRYHYADLEEKALAKGLLPKDAATRAKELLGAQDLIVEEVLARPELKTGNYGWAWALAALGPIVLFAAIAVTPTCCSM